MVGASIHVTEIGTFRATGQYASAFPLSLSAARTCEVVGSSRRGHMRKAFGGAGVGQDGHLDQRRSPDFYFAEGVTASRFIHASFSTSPYLHHGGTHCAASDRARDWGLCSGKDQLATPDPVGGSRTMGTAERAKGRRGDRLPAHAGRNEFPSGFGSACGLRGTFFPRSGLALPRI